jgi:hypothetical protein
MDDQRIEFWSSFGLKDFRYGQRIQRVAGKAVDRFSGKSDDLAFAQQFNRRIAVG